MHECPISKRLVGVLLAALSLATPATAQTGSFDPTICPGDHQGKLTVRLESGRAFRIQPHGFLLGRLTPEPAGPGLPPWGCPGNPVVTSSFTLAYRYEAILEDRRNLQVPEDFGRPSLLRIIAGDGPVVLQESNLQLFREYKNRFGSCEITDEGLEICRTCEIVDGWCRGANPDRPVSKDAAGMFGRALPGVHEERDGLPFAIMCPSRSLSEPGLPPKIWCSVSYRLMDGVSVNYRITDHKVGEDEYIAFDSEVRRQIKAARAPELDAR